MGCSHGRPEDWSLQLGKRERKKTFAEIAAEASKEPRGDRRDGLARSRVDNEGVWDPDGRFWARSDEIEDEEFILRLLADATVTVGAQRGFGRDPEWPVGAQRERLWMGEVRSCWAKDRGLPAAGWPKHVAYTVERRTRAAGEQLLWFQGHC